MNMCGFCSTTDLGKRDFFMQKLKLKSIYNFCKSCITQSKTKLVFQFLDFSTILYGFYKTLDQRGET
jgi:hypothetical protein